MLMLSTMKFWEATELPCVTNSGGYNTVKVDTKNKLTAYSLKGIFRKCSLNFLSEEYTLEQIFH